MGEDTITETTNLLLGKQEKHTEQVKTHSHTHTHLQFSPAFYNMNIFSCSLSYNQPLLNWVIWVFLTDSRSLYTIDIIWSQLYVLQCFLKSLQAFLITYSYLFTFLNNERSQ